MNRIVVDSSTVEKLRGFVDPLELCDDAGNVLGHFTPRLKGTEFPGMEPQISEEELTRRAKERSGRRLSEILADLESQS